MSGECVDGHQPHALRSSAYCSLNGYGDRGSLEGPSSPITLTTPLEFPLPPSHSSSIFLPNGYCRVRSASARTMLVSVLPPLLPLLFLLLSQLCTEPVGAVVLLFYGRTSKLWQKDPKRSEFGFATAEGLIKKTIRLRWVPTQQLHIEKQIGRSTSNKWRQVTGRLAPFAVYRMVETCKPL
jgi:hypothetical protein